MISYELFCQIRPLADQQQLNAAQIAAKLHLDGKTVAKWMNRPNYQQRQKVKRPSKLDSFKGQIVALLETHPYSSQQIFQRLKSQGYTGGYSILKELVRLLRPVRKTAHLTLAFAPGQWAQGDWGSFGWN
jgi:hypothetical protein